MANTPASTVGMEYSDKYRKPENISNHPPRRTLASTPVGTAMRYEMGNAIRLMRSVTGSAAAIRSHTGRFFENATPRSGVSKLTTSGISGMPLVGYGCAWNACIACACATTAAVCEVCMSEAAFSNFGHAAFE